MAGAQFSSSDIDGCIASLGSLDSEIREAALDRLDAMIVQGGISTDRLVSLSDELTNDLLRGVGDHISDGVFKRSFSALIVGAIISYDELCDQKPGNSTQSFITREIYDDWFLKSIRYFTSENDLRGYTSESGWAHAAAHGADLLRELAFSRFCSVERQKIILSELSSKIIRPTVYPFLYNEDNRLSRVAVTILLRNELRLDDYKEWISSIIRSMPLGGWMDVSKDDRANIAWNNTVNFLRAFYFNVFLGCKKLKDSPLYDREIPNKEAILGLLADALRSIDR